MLIIKKRDRWLREFYTEYKNVWAQTEHQPHTYKLTHQLQALHALFITIFLVLADTPTPQI